MMEQINKLIKTNAKYKRLQKPLEAAKICEIARALSRGRFGAVSFCRGVLCLSVESSTQAANLVLESEKIISALNQKIGQPAIKRLRFKIV